METGMSPERLKWLYLLAGLLAGAAAVFVFDRFPGGAGDRRQARNLEFRFVEGQTYRVLSVYDGDTIVVEPGVRLRYAGIDAPETGEFVEFDEQQRRPFAKEAKETNERLVANRQVRLSVKSAQFDKYGRLLSGVEVQDPETGKWLDVEEELLRTGLVRRPPWPTGPLSNEPRLRDAEASARHERLGVWSEAGAGSFPPKKKERKQP